MRYILTILITVGCCGFVNAQTVLTRQAIGTAGTNTITTNSNVTISQTVGEAIVGTGNGNTVEITQGFQQPELLLVLPNTLNYFNAFTPDGDGTNDFWVIPDLTFYPENTVTVFNRWGDQLIKINNYDNSTVVWDGTDKNGEMLDPSTYFFIIEYTTDTGRKAQTGWVHMMR